MRNDEELLRRYAAHQAEGDFAELVHRHLDMVWGAARRITNDDHLASDVAQTVFVDLSHKANQISEEVVLAGWLYRAASFAASKVVRSNIARTAREQKLVEFSPRETEACSLPESDEFMPLLDEGLGQLPARDRDAVLLRFFDHKSFAELGIALGISEDAAQKRVSRALNKLKGFFQTRGAPGSVSVSMVLSAAASQLAPTNLAAAIISTATISTATTSGIAGVITSLKTQALTMKIKIAIPMIAATSMTVPLVVQQQTLNQLRGETASLRQEVETLPEIRKEHEKRRIAQLAIDELERLRKERPELTSLRAEAASLHGMDLAEKRRLQSHLAEQRLNVEAARARTQYIQAEMDAQQLREDTARAMMNLGLAARIWATDNEDTFPPSFQSMTNELNDGWLKGGLTLNDFEWVPHARPVSEMEPQLALYREKQPRHLPDGLWERSYTLCDGSVQTFQSGTKDFSKIEKEKGMIASDPTIPEQFIGHPAYERQSR
jgi:RNA polymerase sigma factor (sigma-70 family)